eukprot:TRINITY_DN8508_c0_g1_i1.p1 TRINITY_DN8508_c0_g1~~TRINITY_DN8508_c0_g1_i1.p1  ORF type:complete len:571 (+),score=64.36 TRINITY_DN8508_c0_g1_i1:39-1751(+)
MSDSSSISPPPSPGYRCLALYQASVALQRRKDELHNQVEARRSSLCQVKKVPKEDLDATFDRLHSIGARTPTPKRNRRHDDDEEKPAPPPTKEIKDNPRCLALYESGRDAMERRKKLQEAEEEKRSGIGKGTKLSPTKLQESCDRLYKSGAKPNPPLEKENEEPLRSASPATRRVEELYQRGKNLLSQRRSSFQDKFGSTGQSSRTPPPLLPNSRLEQLYQTAFHKRENIERRKAEMEEDELRICTFSPAINTIRYVHEERPHTPAKIKHDESAVALGEMLTTEEGGWVAEPEPRSHKLYRNALETRERLLHEQERRRRQDLRECTFTPKINRTGRDGDVFSSLYTDAIAQRERRARELDERWGEGASSTPMLQSPYRASPSRREPDFGRPVTQSPGPARARSPARTPVPATLSASVSPVPEATAPSPTQANMGPPQSAPPPPTSAPAPTLAPPSVVPSPTVDVSPLYVRPEIRLLGSSVSRPPASPRLSDLPELHGVVTTSHIPPARHIEPDLSPLPTPRSDVDVYTTITTTTVTPARLAPRPPICNDRYVDLAAMSPLFGARAPLPSL